MTSQLLRAQLKYSQPEYVFDWFQKNAEIPFSWKELEETLLSRNSPLINLALAQYGKNHTMVKLLFTRSDKDLRLAALSNRSISTKFDWSPDNLPLVLFERDDRLFEFLVSAPSDELNSLLSNPTLDNEFLEHLFTHTGICERIEEPRWRALLTFCCGNPRLDQPFDSSYRGYRHNLVFEAVWKLGTLVQPTPEWADTLSWLFAITRARPQAIEDWASTIQRWRIEENAFDYGAKGHLDNFGLVRLQLARGSGMTGITPAHADIAMRCAAYRHNRLSKQDLEEAFAREPGFLLTYALENEAIWKEQVLRDLLASFCRTKATVDRDVHWQFPRHFNAVQSRMQEQHAEWFKEEPLPSDRELLLQLNKQLTLFNESLTQFKADSKKAVFGIVACIVVILLLIRRW